MKRRDFIGSLIAGATLATLPFESFSSVSPITWNTATLTAKLEEMFSCQMGPSTAFVYMKGQELVEPKLVWSADPSYPNIQQKSYAPQEDCDAYQYETYAVCIKGGTAEEAEAKLSKYMFDEMSKVPAGNLVWRVKPQFASQEVIEYGGTWMTSEALEDSREKPEIPEGVGYNIASGNYEYIKDKYTIHRMRMRLVLPEIYDEEKASVPSIFKAEGTLGVPIVL